MVFRYQKHKRNHNFAKDSILCYILVIKSSGGLRWKGS